MTVSSRLSNRAYSASASVLSMPSHIDIWYFSFTVGSSVWGSVSSSPPVPPSIIGMDSTSLPVSQGFCGVTTASSSLPVSQGFTLAILRPYYFVPTEPFVAINLSPTLRLSKAC